MLFPFGPESLRHSHACSNELWHINTTGGRGRVGSLAPSNDGLQLHNPLLDPYNTERLISFLEELHDWLVPADERGKINSPNFIVVWDNVAFHHSAAVTDWFAAHPRMSVLFLPPYIPFLNPKEEFFSAWRWKVNDHHPHDQMSLLDAMNVGCGDTSPEVWQGY